MKKTNFVLYFRVKWKLLLIRFDMTFAAYYAKKRGEGKPHRVAITHVAKKLISEHKTYDNHEMSHSLMVCRSVSMVCVFCSFSINRTVYNNISFTHLLR